MKINIKIASLMIACVCFFSYAQADDLPPLKVALDGTFAPHAMPKMGGGIEGFNVDLANEVAKKMGRRINIIAAQFSGLIPAMQAGTYDFIVAPVTITKERAENVLFSEGYYNSDYQFVVKKGTPEINSLDGFRNKTLAVNKGAEYDIWARKLADEYQWKVVSYGTNTDAIQAVVSNKAFAAITGITPGAWAVKKNPRIALSYTQSTNNVWGMAFRKDDTATRAQVDRIIECLKVDGTISRLAEKWFGLTPAAGSAAVTPMPGYGPPGLPGYEDTPHPLTCEPSDADAGETLP
ncbi:transporter substrate-binding domain-containing protein [Brenneria goodwinii]|uniref:transporter substrate-binding domain-containing protein n=1 Tax=Brenneria goodwinii TaxID=1109412 RepID=UPI0036EB0415